MWDYFFSFGNEIMRFIGRMDRQQWVVVFCLAVIIGFFCMRGFGSRANY